ncbi:glycosyltransferase [Candidatus Accumulibacter sp. ACC012]|uniref:glycosyltransferase n=1 Tax=Candidatus Accumulibacter sp. ACC012 TaxID=2823332 RepID=UPI0025B9DFE0|nr:glycosyltransferase [Candidatus Accumulibacter sp. ACC012]
MRCVVHVISGLGRGGAERALTRLLEAQRGSLDYAHVVISLADMGCYGESIQRMGVPVHVLGMTGVLGLPTGLVSLVRLLRRLRPDLVQTWMYHADLLGGVSARFAGRPPVLWGIRSFDLKRGAKLRTRLVQKVCAWTSHWLPTLILCVAEASRRNHAALGYDERRMLVIPNGFELMPPEIPAPDVDALRAAHGLLPRHVVVGCVGRFHPAKDHRNFVDAAALLGERFPLTRFLMVGPGLDAGNAVLRGWIEAGRMSDRFVLLGERTDIPLCLKAMEIFCSPSRTEAFPQVVGEAMVVGRPAVVTDVGDTARVVGDTAVVVAREDPQALAAGLASLLEASPGQREELGRRAQARVRREFSIEKTVELTINAYELALGAGK